MSDVGTDTDFSVQDSLAINDWQCKIWYETKTSYTVLSKY